MEIDPPVSPDLEVGRLGITPIDTERRRRDMDRGRSHRRRWPIPVGVCALLVGLAAVPLAQPPSATFAIVSAQIVDGSGGEPFEGTVLVRDGRIERVGPEVKVPDGVRVIDGRGKTVLPGLFDLHVHLFGRAVGEVTPDLGKHLAAYLYCGVTTIAELGMRPTTFAAVRELLASDHVQAPRVALAARFGVPGGHGTTGGWPSDHTQQVSTPEEARAAVDHVASFRPDLLKVFADGWRYGMNPDLNNMELETLSALTDQARRHGLRVVTHTVTTEGARVAADGGVGVLVHGIGNEVADARLANGLRQRNMTYVTTLAVYEPRDRPRWTPLLWRLVEPATRAQLEADVAADATTPQENGGVNGRNSGGRGTDAAAPVPQSPASRAQSELSPREMRWRVLQDNVDAMRAQGVRLGVGTDAGITGSPHGWSTLHELRLLVAAGLTPLEALTAATGNSAWALGVQDDRGFLTFGKRADLVVIDGDPVADIDAIERIERVFVDGREVDRPALEALMTSEAPTPVPAVATGALIDDFERRDGVTARGTRWVDRKESGPYPTVVEMTRVARGGGQAMRVAATMSDAEQPFATLSVPLGPGGLRPVDASRFRGVRFDARGEGRYRVAFETRGVRNGAYHESSFAAASTWIPVALHFESAVQPRTEADMPLPAQDLMAITFHLTGTSGETAWLEIDNLRFY